MTPSPWTSMIVLMKKWIAKREKRSADSKRGWEGPGVKERRTAARWGRPEAISTQSAQSKKAWSAPGARQRRGLAISQGLSNQQVREGKSARMKLFHKSNPDKGAEFGAKSRRDWADRKKKKLKMAAIKRAVNEPEAKDKKVLSMLMAWDDPEKSDRMTAGIRESMKDSGMLKRRGAKIKKAVNTPEVKAKKIATLKITNAKPEVHDRRSADSKKRWSDPTTAARMRVGQFRSLAASFGISLSREDVERMTADTLRRKTARSAAGRHRRHSEAVLKAAKDFRAQYRLEYGQDPSWVKTLSKVDSVKFKGIKTSEGRQAAASLLRLAVGYLDEAEAREEKIIVSRPEEGAAR
jgi:hypothetical protein